MHDNLAAALPTLELLGEQSYDRFCYLILATKARNYISGSHEGDNGLLRRQHPSIPRLQQIVIPFSLPERRCMMAYHQKLAGHPDFTKFMLPYTRLTIDPHGR